MAKPRGAMSAGDGGYGKLLNGRGNPPRYNNLPHSEAWAKIDAEEAAHIKSIDDARIEQEVQRRVLALKESAPEQEAEAPCNKFGAGEMAKVLTAIAQVELGEIAHASDSGIVITINDVKVCICKE